MRYLVTVLCILLLVGSVFGKVYDNPKKETQTANRVRTFNDVANPANAFFADPRQAPSYNDRDFGFAWTLLDSSKNGYGMYSNNTNPIEFVPTKGIIASYRQWQGVDASSGYIGAAQSTDGVSWMVAQTLNTRYPGDTDPDGAGGLPTGRYPSVGASFNSYPSVIWNEYTQGSGGGTNGGRAMYTFDQFDWMGGSFASPVYDLNTGCNPLPCNPEDLWVSQGMIIDEGTTPVMMAGFEGALAWEQYYLLRSSWYSWGYFGMASPVVLMDRTQDFFWDPTANYTGYPEMHLNDDGVGYFVSVSYWNDYQSGGSTVNHTFWYKKTTDYGLTWSSTGGKDGTGYNYIPDDVFNNIMEQGGLLGDSLWEVVDDDTIWHVLTEAFAGYDYDVKVDADGGLHIAATVIATYPGAGGVYPTVDNAGHWHLYNPTPDDNSTWEASLIRDMSASFTLDYGTSDPTTGYQYLSPDLGMSTDPESEVLWHITSVADTTQDTAYIYFEDLDIHLAVSEDNGATWTDLGNQTYTTLDVPQYYELDAHMAGNATDGECYFIWQVPDFSYAADTSNGLWADYKQWVYVGKYSRPVATDKEELLPRQFSLQQNYPNPFNPTTVINYQLNVPGNVKLELFNTAGQKVRSLVNEQKPAGEFEYTLHGNDLASGVYFYKLTHKDVTETRKLVLMK